MDPWSAVLLFSVDGQVHQNSQTRRAAAADVGEGKRWQRCWPVHCSWNADSTAEIKLSHWRSCLPLHSAPGSLWLGLSLAGSPQLETQTQIGIQLMLRDCTHQLCCFGEQWSEASIDLHRDKDKKQTQEGIDRALFTPKLGGSCQPRCHTDKCLSTATCIAYPLQQRTMQTQGDEI